MKNVHEIEIKLEGEKWTNCLDKAFKKVNKDIKIDGFRKGAAPKDVYLKKYGIESLYNDAINDAINVAYKELLDNNKLVPIVEPQVDVTGISDGSVIFKFKIITKPEIKLSSYNNLGVKKDKVSVSKEELNTEIENLRNQLAEVVVKEGKVENGDIAIIDFTGYKDGVAFEGGKGENYSLTIGSKTFIPGFEEAVIGMERGSEKDIDLTFPKDYMSEELKGKKVTFHVKVNDIKRREVPKLDKDFFDDLSMEGVNSKETLEHEVMHELEHQKEHEQEHIYEEKCLDKAALNMEVTICDELIDDEVEHMYKEFMQRMAMQGITEEMYYQYTKSKKEDITSQMKEDAVKRIKYRYLLKEIIAVEKIKVTDKDAKARVKEMAKTYNVDEETILKDVSLDDIKFDLMYQNALDIVTNNEEK